jgi:hypothetical protein
MLPSYADLRIFEVLLFLKVWAGYQAVFAQAGQILDFKRY